MGLEDWQCAKLSREHKVEERPELRQPILDGGPSHDDPVDMSSNGTTIREVNMIATSFFFIDTNSESDSKVMPLGRAYGIASTNTGVTRLHEMIPRGASASFRRI